MVFNDFSGSIIEDKDEVKKTKPQILNELLKNYSVYMWKNTFHETFLH